MNKQLEAEFDALPTHTKQIYSHVKSCGESDVVYHEEVYVLIDKSFLERIHTEARKELIAEVEGMKLLEVGFSPERLHHKQHHNQIIDSILTHLRDEGRE